MWYIQINNNVPQKMVPSDEVNKNAKQRTKWQFRIAHPETLDILYIFNEYSGIKHSYTIKVSVGSLPEFHLGSIDNTTPYLQSEPNFPIQPNVRCYVTMEQIADKALTSNHMISSSNQINRINELKRCAAVCSFNNKFDCFMKTLKWFVLQSIIL